MSKNWDVIVVGAGMAGLATAIEAADNGASVLLLDREHGGGASALSGGIVYAGGGTHVQQSEGYEDTPENMFNYLREEVEGVVSDETLMRFCEQSRDNLKFLEDNGAKFKGGVPPYKTSYPTDDHYLYFSGSEAAYPFKEKAVPVPRGHRMVAKGLGSGKALWNAVFESALAKGIEYVPMARVEELIVEQDKVVGVKFMVMEDEGIKAGLHKFIIKNTGKLSNFFPDALRFVTAPAHAIFNANAVEAEARGSNVVLTAGGFIYNPEWVEKYAPIFRDINPLGTPNDDGLGIKLGMDVGGTVDHMDKVTAWRFITPPPAWLKGVAVGMNGKRIVNEDVYGARLGNFMMREHDSKGWLIHDSETWKEARSQIFSHTQIFQLMQALAMFTIGHKRAGSLEEIADKIGVDKRAFLETVRAYNDGVRSGEGDPAGKGPENSAVLENAPFYAMNLEADNAMYFPLPGLSLGGLVVDEATGEVQNADGEAIEGLYAAGRNAVGVCSNSYVSGLSLADCVFSGRRAGKHAATKTSDAKSVGA